MKNKKRQEVANQHFSKLADPTLHPAIRVGRPESAKEKESLIVAEIFRILDLSEPNLSLIDIGCGAGFIALNLVDFAVKNKARITFVDIESVIDLLEADINRKFGEIPAGIDFIRGVFPDISMPQEKYSRVLSYSVLHYPDDPEDFIDRAVSLLAPGGKLFIGDIPNKSKRGRFLASNFGREFEAKYQNKPLQEIPVFNSHHDFVKMDSVGETNILDDSFLLRVMEKYRNQGLDVFIQEQKKDLPMSFTREDLIMFLPRIFILFSLAAFC